MTSLSMVISHSHFLIFFFIAKHEF